jgi:hypothetical protein
VLRDRRDKQPARFAKQAEVERERRAKMINADGEYLNIKLRKNS